MIVGDASPVHHCGDPERNRVDTSSGGPSPLEFSARTRTKYSSPSISASS